MDLQDTVKRSTALFPSVPTSQGPLLRILRAPGPALQEKAVGLGTRDGRYDTSASLSALGITSLRLAFFINKTEIIITSCHEDEIRINVEVLLFKPWNNKQILVTVGKMRLHEYHTHLLILQMKRWEL